MVLTQPDMRGLRQNDQYSLDARPTVLEIQQALAEAEKFIDRMEQLVKASR